MPRGRPRKNPLPELGGENSQPIINKNSPPTTTETNPSSTTSSIPSFLSPSEYDKLPICDRCHNKIISGEKNINLTYLTSMASWHRDVEKDRITLCSDCAKELNGLIDKWLINDGKGIKSKWDK